MEVQGKKSVGMKIIPTAFDLRLGLSDAVQNATSHLGDEDFGDIVEGQAKAEHLCSDRNPNVHAAAEKQGMHMPKCGVTMADMRFRESHSVLTANLGSSACSDGRRKRRNKGRCARREKKRKLDAEEDGQEDVKLKGVALKHLREMVDGHSATAVETRAEDLKAAAGGWLGSLKNTFSREESSLRQLLESRFKLVEWDGR